LFDSECQESSKASWTQRAYELGPIADRVRKLFYLGWKKKCTNQSIMNHPKTKIMRTIAAEDQTALLS